MECRNNTSSITSIIHWSLARLTRFVALNPVLFLSVTLRTKQSNSAFHSVIFQNHHQPLFYFINSSYEMCQSKECCLSQRCIICWDARIDSANQLVVANHDVMPLWKTASHFLSWRGQKYFEARVKRSRSPCKMNFP